MPEPVAEINDTLGSRPRGSCLLHQCPGNRIGSGAAPASIGWEGVGDASTKISVPAQLTHSLALSYTVRAAAMISSTLEALTDARALIGMEYRPGRAHHFKGVIEF